jgi:hypothetical protein
MHHSVVSMKGKDDRLQAIETDAASLFAAAYAGIQKWVSFGGISTKP